MIKNDNLHRFLTMLKILYLETSRTHPLNKVSIMRRMKKAGYSITDDTFHRYIAVMRAHDISILFDTKTQYGYWYAGGWLDGTDAEQM